MASRDGLREAPKLGTDLALALTDCQIGLGTPALGVLNFLQVPLAGQKSAPYVAPGTSGKGSPFAVVRQRKI